MHICPLNAGTSNQEWSFSKKLKTFLQSFWALSRAATFSKSKTRLMKEHSGKQNSLNSKRFHDIFQIGTWQHDTAKQELLSIWPTWQSVENRKDMFYEAAAAICHAMLGPGRADTLSKLEAMVQLQRKNRKRKSKFTNHPCQRVETEAVTWHGQPAETAAAAAAGPVGTNVVTSSYIGHWSKDPSVILAFKILLQKGSRSTSTWNPGMEFNFWKLSTSD